MGERGGWVKSGWVKERCVKGGWVKEGWVKERWEGGSEGQDARDRRDSSGLCSWQSVLQKPYVGQERVELTGLRALCRVGESRTDRAGGPM